MDLDYLEDFYQSVLAKVKIFGNWESTAFLAGCFVIKCQLSETIQSQDSLTKSYVFPLSCRGQLEQSKVPTTFSTSDLLFIIGFPFCIYNATL